VTGMVSKLHNVLCREREEREELTYLTYNAYLTYKEDFLRVQLCI